MALLKINDVNLNVIEFNKAASETIVMIHGLFTNTAVYYFTIAPKLAEKYHVVLYDMKGHGMSERVASGYDIQSMSDDLVEILNVLERPKVHLTGYSYGGLIVLYVAMCHPEKIDKIALIEAPDPSDEELRKVLEKEKQYSFEQYVPKLLSTTSTKPSLRHLEKIYKQHQSLFNETSIIDDISGNRNLFQEIAQANISHQTLLLYANGSGCGEAGEFLHQQINNSCIFFRDGDHNLPVQHPEWVTEKLYDFYTAEGGNIGCL